MSYAIEFSAATADLSGPAATIDALVAPAGAAPAEIDAELRAGLETAGAIADGSFEPRLEAGWEAIADPLVALLLERGPRRGRGWIGRRAAAFLHPLADGRSRLATLALGLFGLILGGARLFAPYAMVTEIGPAGFRVHDSFGRVQHDIRWDEVERFVEVAGNAPLRPGALRLVGWMLHQPTRARTRPFGHKVDGHLPEVYDGFAEVLGLMLRRANAGSSRPEAF